MRGDASHVGEGREEAADIDQKIISRSTRLQAIEHDIAAAPVDDPDQPRRAIDAERTVGELGSALASDDTDS